MTFNRGGLSTHYAIERGQFATLDGTYLCFIDREATLTQHLDAIESRYLREVRFHKFGESAGQGIRLSKDQIIGLHAFLADLIADIEGDEQL